MKSVLIIGIGCFGRHLTIEMSRLDNEIMIVDRHEEKIEDLLPIVVGGKIADCREQKVIDSLGVSNYDICFVAIAKDFESSMVITSMLKSSGAPRVVSLANSAMQQKLLEQIGADRVVFPDRDIAHRISMELSSDQVKQYIDLPGEYGIYEIEPEKEWLGRTVQTIDVRNHYNMNIIGVRKNTNEELNLKLGPDYIFTRGETLLVIGEKKKMQKLVSQD